ncbi:hypothetical protein FDP41_001074 [Naegleria fowleri]|uniref:UBX domain-containing protein n=1 Tax=Naegleria fowleri TaxID=5763 RepID=A0A6A5BZD1_NAEFO|nr:uncharacterized protein FDP41_001074 [Naegleria fowleri]KAF0979921.1 hypothetical protein FDP41_001074 [Naegleria fowleri]CAG4708267.1 unnamed protein product [Naegleria fowleri]
MSDPLADDRRLAAEKRNQWLSSIHASSSSSNNNSSSSIPSSTRPQQGHAVTTQNDNQYHQNNNNNTTDGQNYHHANPTLSESTSTTFSKPKLKLIEKSTQDIIKEREEELNRFSDILNPLTEKKKFIEKLKKEQEQAMKKERQEKEKLLKAYRTDPHIGKKTISIDYPNIDNRMALNSPTKPSESLETIFESVESNDLYSEPCIIQIRFIDGTITKAKFNSNDKLTQVCQYIFSSEKGKDYKNIRIRIPAARILQSGGNSGNHGGNSGGGNGGDITSTSHSIEFSTSTTISYFNNTNMSLYTLEQLNLCPNGNIIIENDMTDYGFGEKDLKSDKTSEPMNYLPVEYFLQYAGSSYRLKGDTWEEKQKFRERQREKDVKQCKLEKIQKKKELDMVRKRLEEDKKERNEKKHQLLLSSNVHETSTTKDIHLSSLINDKDDKSHHYDSLKNFFTVHSSCSIQVRLPHGGSIVRIDSLLGGNTLKDLFDAIQQNSSAVNVSMNDCVFIVQFPHAEYDSSVFKRITLLDAKLVPRGSIVLESNRRRE